MYDDIYYNYNNKLKINLYIIKKVGVNLVKKVSKI